MSHFWLHVFQLLFRKQLVARPILKQILDNAGWLFFDKLLRLGVGLFVGVWIARYLGPEQYGLWSFTMAFTALFAAIATLGVDRTVVSELVKHPELRNELLGSALRLKIIGGILALLMSIGAIALMRRGETLLLWLVGILAVGFIFQALNVIDLFFQAEVRSKYSVYAADAAFIIMTLAKIFLLLAAAPLSAFVLTMLGEMVLNSFFLILAYHTNHASILAWRYDKKVARGLMRDSWPLMIVSIASFIQLKIDQVMLGQLSTMREVGIYAAAARILEIISFIPIVVVSSVMPSIITFKSLDQNKYLEKSRKVISILFLLALTVSIFLFFSAGIIMKVLLGAKYNGVDIVLRILVWASLFIFIGAGVTPMVMADNLIKWAMVRSLIGALLSVILNFVLIPIYGAVGAALSMVVSMFFIYYLFNYFGSKTRYVFRVQSLAMIRAFEIFLRKKSDRL